MTYKSFWLYTLSIWICGNYVSKHDPTHGFINVQYHEETFLHKKKRIESQ